MHSKSLLAGMLFAAAVITGPAQAQYPDKPINYILAFAPGGESDISARFQQPFFEKLGKQQAVIKYQAGAGGAQAWSQLNSMPGDGYTIMGTNLPHIVLQPIQKDVGYKTDDLVNVYFFHYTPDAIFVPIDSKFKTLNDLIDFAKKNPGQVTFAGSGSFTSNHLAQQRLDELTGIKTTYVPFAGSGPSISAVLGNQVTAGFNYSTTFLNQSGKVRMLAVASESRLPTQKDSPTFKELGINLVGGAYRGLGVPKSSPENVRKEVSDLIGKINADPEFKKTVAGRGVMASKPVFQWLAKRLKTSYIALALPTGK
jgi:tripartite-type tricarboxylate transporter receptor subunit TctC